MFGYIKPMVSELKIREYELYKSIYCGLCRSMGEHICKSQRFTLSYDIVFLALVLAALTDEKIHIDKKRCALHPIKKRNCAKIPDALKYSSQAAAVLTYYNILDDINDSGRISGIKYRLILPAAKRFLKKSDSALLISLAQKNLGDLARSEKEGGSLDRSADCFASLLAAVFSIYPKDSATSRIAYDIGFHVGRWIYIIDAADDIEKDRKNNTYNPLLSFDSIPYDMLKASASLELAGAKKAFDSADIKNKALAAIIDNILTLGMPDTAEKILKEKNNND